MKQFFKNTIALTAIILSATLSASAFEITAGTKKGSTVGVDVTDINREGNYLNTDLVLNLSKVNMSGNGEVVVTPMYVNGTDTLRMESLSIAGRNRWYYLQRNNMVHGLVIKGFGADKGTFINGQYTSDGAQNARIAALNSQMKTYSLQYSVPWSDWLEDAVFTVETQTRGCANCEKKNPDGQKQTYSDIARTDFGIKTYYPEFLYVAPKVDSVKMREISARAYIDFPVNRTEIYPDYHNNPEELGKIRATIDSVNNDKDIKVLALHISGTASPEGSYQNNIRLAKGRTESLKNYVQGLYHFPPGFITTSFQPVDWQGLRDFLEGREYFGGNTVESELKGDANDVSKFMSNENNPEAVMIAEVEKYVPHRLEILGIVNSNIEDYNRNQKIMRTYPQEYDWLLKNVYPSLRHSDYRIAFEIKTYSDITEILEVMATKPSNLSLAELFRAANSQPVGSPLYDQAFDLAVTMYPDDETANLNAGINAMRRGDIMSAEKYLPKAGESVEADYARALLTLLQGDEETAYKVLQSLSGSLNPQVAEKAKAAVAGIEAVRKSNSSNFIKL